jgi:histidine decarboxylase
MYMGRTILKGRTGETPKCYFTREAHYSIQILSDLLGLDRIIIETLPDAGMDPVDLKHKLAEHHNHPALVVATIGTTFKGGIDQIDEIKEVLKEYESYLHLDAALFGGYLPHISGRNVVNHNSLNNPSRPRYDSIAVSCHKFFGFPSPAGLFVTTLSNFDTFNELYSNIHNPEYIGHVPGTITCSRDAVKPAEFYFFSTPSAFEKQVEDARAILQNTTFLMDQMLTHFPDLQPVRESKLSNTVFFKKPAEHIVRKYSLATMHLEEKGEFQDFAHIVVMPHANQDVLSEFLNDLDDEKFLRLG